LFALGRTEEVILQNFEAFGRGDIDGLISGWHGEGELRPLTRPEWLRGHDQIRRFFVEEADRLTEFRFRIDAVLAQKEHALVFGCYRGQAPGGPVDQSVFWIARVEGEKVATVEAFEHVGEAFSEFRRRLQAKGLPR
jgi:ketosteroid isomerase-like protein